MSIMNRSPSDRKFKAIKPELRILGIDDFPFTKSDKTSRLVFTVYRGGSFLDGVLSTTIEVDGLDATEKIIERVLKTRHHDQIRVVMLNGVTFGGFNVVDIMEIFDRTKIPVIVVMRRKPDFDDIDRALQNFRDAGQRRKIMERAGEIHLHKLGFFFQTAGISREDAASILSLSCTHAKIPEPLRIAHLIAGGIGRGESKGRA